MKYVDQAKAPLLEILEVMGHFSCDEIRGVRVYSLPQYMYSIVTPNAVLGGTCEPVGLLKDIIAFPVVFDSLDWVGEYENVCKTSENPLIVKTSDGSELPECIINVCNYIMSRNKYPSSNAVFAEIPLNFGYPGIRYITIQIIPKAHLEAPSEFLFLDVVSVSKTEVHLRFV